MSIISVDLGYRYVKAINKDFKKVLFPSFVSKAVSQNIESYFTSRSTVQEIDLDKLHINIKEYDKDEEYYVGEMAAGTKRPILSFGENKIKNNITKALVATATGILTKGNEESLHVSAGLPLMQFASQEKELYEFLRDLNLTVEFLQPKGVKMRRKVCFDKVTLFPQGAAAIYYVAIGQHDLLEKNGVRIGLIDIGGKTTEALMFRVKDHNVEGELDRCDTFDLGTSYVEERVRSYFQKEHYRRLENNELYEILKTGIVYFKRKKLDVGKVIEEARHELADLIKEELNHLWGKSQDMAYMILLAGGGASDIMPYFMSENTLLINDAQYANAWGNLAVVALQENDTGLLEALYKKGPSINYDGIRIYR